jgi:hypothetical protein
MSEQVKRPLSLARFASPPRRGLSRLESAMYLGISPTKFDELRKMGLVEPARLIGDRKVWDIRELDMAFDALPRENQQIQSKSWFDE